MRLFSLVLLFVYLSSASAFEVDNITERHKKISDSGDIIDAEMNRRLEAAVARANSAWKIGGGKRCEDKKLLREALESELRASKLDWGEYAGKLEVFAEDNDKVQKVGKLPLNQSIYANTPIDRSSSSFAKWAESIRNIIDKDKASGLQSSIKLHGVWIGTDKLGHFVDEGMAFFNAVQAKDLNAGFEAAQKHEKGIAGRQSTFIFSWGDIAANYSGFLFWDDLLNQNYYISCDKFGNFKVERPFTFKKYVNDTWDEGINCSGYHTDEVAKQVNRNIAKLKNECMDSKPCTKQYCPVDVEGCKRLAGSLDTSVLLKVVGEKCFRLIDRSQPGRFDGMPRAWAK